MNKYRFIFVALLLFPVANLIAADIPMTLNYQGNVTDATGSPLNGGGHFKFAIVDAAGTTTFWVNDNSTTNGAEPTTSVSIPITNGLFSVKLGDTNLTNMAALNAAVFNNTNIYLRVWFSFDALNFEQFSPDTQIVSTGFAFKAQEANAVVDSAVTSNSIQDNSINNADISDTAAISASKIDSLGLDSDTLDGLDAADFAASTHDHTNIDADTIDGLDSLDFAFSIHGHPNFDADTVDGFHAIAFAPSIHGHAHGELLGIGSSDHHVKTISFTEMVDDISTAQIPDSITRDTEAAASYVAKSGDTITGPLIVNDNVSVQSLSYQQAQTKYLMLAGGQCAGASGSRQSFSCEIFSTSTPGYWSVNIPNGATLLGMQVSVSTADGVTQCKLESGLADSVSVIGTVTDTGPSGWHWSEEAAFNHLVDTSTNAYAVSCSKNLPLAVSFVGAIRIRYTVLAP